MSMTAANLDPGGVRPDHDDALWKGCRRPAEITPPYVP